jgi:hypothetical protein
MKYIFDFDDVLFHNTAQFKEHMFSTLVRAGVPKEEVREYYLKVRGSSFSLKRFIATFVTLYDLGIHTHTVDSIYEDIMSRCHEFVNSDLLARIKKLGRENCYIVTNGNEEFQKDKLRYSRVGNLFDEDKIFIVPGTKRNKLSEICLANKDETVIFIDDKVDPNLKDIDREICTNLLTIQYRSPEFTELLSGEVTNGHLSELKNRH